MFVSFMVVYFLNLNHTFYFYLLLKVDLLFKLYVLRKLSLFLKLYLLLKPYVLRKLSLFLYFCYALQHH